jgi:hypothetical protein
MRGHIDAEALALCREGLLGRRRTARIRAHLSSCSSCAEVDAGLAEVPSLLTLTSVPPMPAELAARISAALAAEAASRPAEAAKTAEAATQATQAAQEAEGAHAAHAAQAAQGTASAVPGVSPRQVPPPASGERTPRGRPGLAPRGRPGLARKVLALAAAVVLVAAGGGYLLSRPHATSGTSASRAAAPSTAHRPAAGAGPSHFAAAGSASAGLSFSAISSGTNYQPGQLTAQVAAVLARYPTPAAGTHAAAPTARAATSQVPTEPYAAALAGCVERIAGGLPPRLVDKARYDGRAATIIVLPASARGPAQVWVVGPTCSGARGDVLAHTSLPGSG